MMTLEEQRVLGDLHPDIKRMIDKGVPLTLGWNNGTSAEAPRHVPALLRERRRSFHRRPTKNPWIQVDSEIIVPDWNTCPPEIASSFPDNSEHGGMPTSTTKLKIRVHKPRKIPKGGCPVMVSFSRGEMAADLCHHWTDLGGIAIDIEYRLSLEYPFPIPMRDCYEGLRWVVANRGDLGLDTTRGLIVAGESTGADFALATAHLYYLNGCSPPLTGIYASVPSGVSRETVPEKYRDHFFSMEQCANAPMDVDLEDLKYARDNHSRYLSSPLAYPVAFPDQSYLAPTYFQVCGYDPVRDCGLILEQVLRDAGVNTKIDIYPGFPHAFWHAFENAPWAQKAIKDSTEGLNWLLRKGEG